MSTSVRVTGLLDTVSEDTVRYYFENKKKSGGGLVENIQLESNRNSAVLCFSQNGGEYLFSDNINGERKQKFLPEGPFYVVFFVTH